MKNGTESKRMVFVAVFLSLFVAVFAWDRFFSGRNLRGTARIVSIEPYETTEYGKFANERGEVFVDHPRFGCIRRDAFVIVKYEFTQSALSFGRDVVRPGTYTNGNATMGTPRDALVGVQVGSEFAMTSHQPFLSLSLNGPRRDVRIPELDDRVDAIQARAINRGCTGMRNLFEDPLPDAAVPPPTPAQSSDAAAPMDAIDRVVARLGATAGLWINGIYQTIPLPADAPIEQVVAHYLEHTEFSEGRVRRHTILAHRTVDLFGGSTNTFEAVHVETDRGTWVLMVHHERDGWTVKQLSIEERH